FVYGTSTKSIPPRAASAFSTDTPRAWVSPSTPLPNTPASSNNESRAAITWSKASSPARWLAIEFSRPYGHGQRSGTHMDMPHGVVVEQSMRGWRRLPDRSLFPEYRHDQHLRFHRSRYRRQPPPARRVARQDVADRQCRLQMRFYPAVPGAGDAVAGPARPRPGGAGFSVRPVRPPGAGRRDRDQDLLQHPVRRDLPDVRQDRGQRRARRPAVQVVEERGQGHPR